MMKNNRLFRMFVGFCGVSVLLLTSGCTPKDTEIFPETDNLLASVQKSDTSPTYDFLSTTAQPEEYSTYINKSTELGLKMLKLENYTKENTAVAPLSLTLSLSAIGNGTSKDTLKEIKNFVGRANLDTDILNQCSAYISQRIRFFNKDGNGVFDTSTLWVSNTFSVKRSFLQKYDNFYNISFYKTDFTQSDISQKIQSYIAAQSADLLPVGNIRTESAFRLYQDSSMSISDCWLTPYDTSAVSKKEFAVSEKETVTAEFLTHTERTFKTDNAQGFIKDFKNVPCKLLCIMPDEDVSLTEYIDALSYDKLLDMPNKVSAMKFSTVSVPKFSVQKSVSLKDTLTKIGIKTLFSEKADFSKGIADNLYLDDITQSVNIRITENGICKDVVSEKSTVTESAKIQQTLVFNRPFIYAVIDNECYVPLILGTVNRPA